VFAEYKQGLDLFGQALRVEDGSGNGIFGTDGNRQHQLFELAVQLNEMELAMVWVEAAQKFVSAWARYRRFPGNPFGRLASDLNEFVATKCVLERMSAGLAALLLEDDQPSPENE
jgi:hypothetical protein